jgi:hypothetical protein
MAITFPSSPVGPRELAKDEACGMRVGIGIVDTPAREAGIDVGSASAGYPFDSFSVFRFFVMAKTSHCLDVFACHHA